MVQLYYSPGACSLDDHIALHEADMPVDLVKVDLKAKTTEDGGDFTQVNAKGYVPALKLDGGEVLTENVAVLSWISDTGGLQTPEGELGRYRLLEMVAFISTELHKAFKPFFSPDAGDAETAAATAQIGKRLDYLAETCRGDEYLFGDDVSVADAYLFVMLLWADKNGLTIPDRLRTFAERMRQRPAVKLALQHEGLS